MQDVKEIILRPIAHPELFRHLRVNPPTGVLLYGLLFLFYLYFFIFIFCISGPPGCGKTLLAHAIAGELGVPFFKISAPEIVSGYSGGSNVKYNFLLSFFMVFCRV